jgi:cytochrome c oxidase subunit 3
MRVKKIKKKVGILGKQRHLYNLVNPSPWPFFGSVGALVTTLGAVLYMHEFYFGGFMLIFGILMGIYTGFGWWYDVVYEATFEGAHTKVVQTGLRIGVILFIISEVMFFFSFFWAYFHASLAPAIQIGSIWPPIGISTMDPSGLPLGNTFILLLSGFTITISHNYVMMSNSLAEDETALDAMIWFASTIFLALLFTIFQLNEFRDAEFTIADGVYGSTFFMATGFHGLHVIIGTIFIGISAYRYFVLHFLPTHHLGFEAAAWYWHFVDVVWLFLFVSIYWWGSL